MREHTFTGPIDRQPNDALSFLKGSMCKERIFKVAGRAESTRVWNWPYEAIEEALGNAIYHRTYLEHEPVTVRVEPDRLSVTSCPGPDRSITDDDLARNHLVGGRYRNRRIGDFLKELRLIEGRNTGVPTMLRALATNGSKPPLFETDEDRTFFRVTFFIHESFTNGKTTTEGASRGTTRRRSRSELRAAIVEALNDRPASQRELAARLGYKSVSKALRETIASLVDEGAITYEGSHKSPSAKLVLVR